jgi:hypothetical protein
MSVAQILGHLRTGDVIIVPASDMPRLPRPHILDSADAVDGRAIKSHKLLRNLIAIRLDGGKKK